MDISVGWLIMLTMVVGAVIGAVVVHALYRRTQEIGPPRPRPKCKPRLRGYTTPPEENVTRTPPPAPPPPPREPIVWIGIAQAAAGGKAAACIDEALRRYIQTGGSILLRHQAECPSCGAKEDGGGVWLCDACVDASPNGRVDDPVQELIERAVALKKDFAFCGNCGYLALAADKHRRMGRLVQAKGADDVQ